MAVTVTKIKRLCRQYGFRAETSKRPERVLIWGGKWGATLIGSVCTDWDWEEIEQHVVKLAMSEAFES